MAPAGAISCAGKDTSATVGALGASAAASSASAADSAASAASCRRPVPPPLRLRVVEKEAKCRWTSPPYLSMLLIYNWRLWESSFLVFAFSLQCRM